MQAPPLADKPKTLKGVYVIEGNKVRFIEVTTGITGEADIEVTSGIQWDGDSQRPKPRPENPKGRDDHKAPAEASGNANANGAE